MVSTEMQLLDLPSKCVRCKILLPKDGMSEESPFNFCGIDMFGLFTVKDGRKEKKRYGALFTCLSSRAVHFEVIHSMTTACFIMCMRRFIGHRGYVRMIRTELCWCICGIDRIISRDRSCKNWIIFATKWW